MITFRLLAGIYTIIFVITLVTSSDDSGSDEEGTERATDRILANAAPEIDPRKRTAMDSKTTLIIALLYDLWTMVKNLRSLIFESVEFFVKLNTSECDKKQTESKQNLNQNLNLSDSTDEMSEDSMMQLFNSTTGNDTYLNSKPFENSDTKTTPTIHHDTIQTEIGPYTSKLATDSVPGLQYNGSFIQSTRSSSSVPVTNYHSKADNGSSTSSTSGPSISQHFANHLTTKTSPSVTAQVPRSTVSGTASNSTTGPTITQLLSTYFSSKSTPSTAVHATVKRTQISSSVPGLIISLHPSKHFTTTPIPSTVVQISRSTGRVNYTTVQVSHSIVSRTASSSKTGPTKFTTLSTKHFTINPNLSTTTNATQQKPVNRTASSSTSSPTITTLPTKNFKPYPIPSTNIHVTQQQTANRTVSSSILSPIITPLSTINPTTKPNPIVEGTRIDSGSIITLLSITQLTSTPSPFTDVPISTGRDNRATTQTTKTITNPGSYKTDQITRPTTVNGTGPSPTTRTIITPLSTTQLTTKLGPYHLNLQVTKDSHIPTLDTSGSTDNYSRKKRKWVECYIKACHGKEECEQEVEAYMECMSVIPVVSRTSGVQVHVFMFMTHLLCSLLYIHI